MLGTVWPARRRRALYVDVTAMSTRLIELMND